MNEAKAVFPFNLGWIISKLDKEEMDFLWKCIDEKGKNHKPHLVSCNDSSYTIVDKDDWFFKNVLSKLGVEYEKQITSMGGRLPINCRDEYEYGFYLSGMWVNYQKQYEFNPLHDHTGVYSFVIWMKIPTDYKEQRELPTAKGTNGQPVISNFCFNYQNIIGGNEQFMYEMSKEVEGTILFFPSELKHAVYPFYNCEEERISISGNIGIDIRAKHPD